MIGRLRWFYFLVYAGVGTWLSYFAPYLRGLGFSGEDIGAVTMAQQLTSVPAALVWGSIGDRLGAPARALRICAGGAAVAILALPFARTPLQVGAALVLAAMFGGGIVPLVDSTTVEAVRHEYARTRLWGSLGFVVSAQAMGFFLAWRGDRPADSAMPIAYVACVVTYALLAQTFPAAEANADRPHWRDAVALLKSPQLRKDEQRADFGGHAEGHRRPGDPRRQAEIADQDAEHQVIRRQRGPVQPKSAHC